MVHLGGLAASISQVLLTNFQKIIMETGVVKFYNEAKGFGFIIDNVTKKEIFVHASGLNGVTIQEHDEVSYEVIDGKKGLNAVKVQKL